MANEDEFPMIEVMKMNDTEVRLFCSSVSLGSLSKWSQFPEAKKYNASLL